MSVVNRVMGLGLRAINRVAGSPLLDRLHLRKPAEQALYHGARIGFRSGAAAARAFKATQKLTQAARPARVDGGGLFDLTPSDEQQMLQEAARRFAADELRPAPAAADAACAAQANLLQGARSEEQTSELQSLM